MLEQSESSLFAYCGERRWSQYPALCVSPLLAICYAHENIAWNSPDLVSSNRTLFTDATTVSSHSILNQTIPQLPSPPLPLLLNNKVEAAAVPSLLVPPPQKIPSPPPLHSSHKSCSSMPVVNSEVDTLRILLGRYRWGTVGDLRKRGSGFMDWY